MAKGDEVRFRRALERLASPEAFVQSRTCTAEETARMMFAQSVLDGLEQQAPTTLAVERHPGPFSGPDAELARACAMAVIPVYGDHDAATHKRIMTGGVWNDHVAVQSALAAIHHLRKCGLK